ncbi:Bug family tripartite tricarboxylate transporter substrate binding protein [Roseomonas haemaphysalidis]|uniref:Tripartite tricarboxylate transporter substrate binding protein n=1 Tax=Roseomonas haemaphysalidis TaxID=2768162 RepID=A0ABS3KV51_9PROT|nr:tripartite tricarboxylate transporter substrate binding protein [Roseomonas haemaphysalidis]MBO1081354.1 tripartite tricarboxylate transporter substrate binding protein [Roseomonas haemaphysalidis]
MTLRRTLLLAAAALPGLAPGAARAQRRPVRLIVPAAPGGAIDVIGRLYANRLGEVLQQTWVVENRSGASNTLGAAEVARAAPDGQTLLVNADIHLMAQRVMRSVPYDPLADFTPIARLATSPMVLVGNPRQTPEGLPALLAALRAQPDRFGFANSALGSMGHLATESLQRAAGVRSLIVSYRGTAPALTDVMSGNVALMVAPLGSALPQVEAGQLRAFAVLSPARASRAPDIPTAAEAGLPGLDFTLWYALWAPKGLPDAEADKLNAAVRTLAQDAGLRARLVEQGAEPVDEDRAAFARFIAAEYARNTRIAEAAGIQPE